MCLKSYLRSSLFIWDLLLFAEHAVTPFDFSSQKLIVMFVSFMMKNLDWILVSFVSFLTDPEHCKKQERIVFFMESPCFSKMVLPKMFPFFVFFPNDSFFFIHSTSFFLLFLPVLHALVSTVLPWLSAPSHLSLTTVFTKLSLWHAW